MASVAEITRYEAQIVGIVHSHVNDNTCLRISKQPFSTSRRKTPAYARLLAISNAYGYMVAGTPVAGLSVFKTSDAETELAKGESKGTNTAVALSTCKEIDLSRFGQPTHVSISADELHVLVATISGSILVFSAASLLSATGDAAPSRTIAVGEEIRDMRANPQELPTTIAVLTLAGAVLIADFATGELKKIVPSSETRITAICWSRKGKQIVCGDTNATLTQRLPTDGTIKRTIKPQTDDDGIPDGSAILAVDWIDTYTFFAVYGLVPDGAFIPGGGGGGNGGSDEDDGFEQNLTSAYVITQTSKLAPLQWLSIEDPCSSMMCPTRYPGFHIASISEWGASAHNILIMAGTSSDVTMTIGQALTRDSELDWAMWDIDGAMAVMPLSAIDDNCDTYPIGMAVDYTSRRDLPPVLDDGDRVSPVPILWILNTDACLLGYRICNTYEMKRNVRCSLMVDQVKPLPCAVSSEPTFARAAAEPAKTTPFASAKAFGGAFGSAAGSSSSPAGAFAKPSTSTLGSFGAATGFAPTFGSSSAVPAFGKSSTIAPALKPPTTLGVTGQHVFGSTSKSGAAPAAFGGFGSTALSTGTSIFDAPTTGPSIFGASDTAKAASPFGAAANTPGPSVFGASDKTKTASLFGAAASTSGPSKDVTAQPALSLSGFGIGQVKDACAKPSDNAPASVPFGSAPKKTLGVTMGSLATNLFDSVKKPSSAAQAQSERSFDSALPTASSSDLGPFPSLAPSRSAKLADKERKEDEKRKEEAARVLELERRNEQARLDALQRELEVKSQALINQQYISTCNSFDHDLKAFALSVKETESAIARVRSACLPPIPLNDTVQRMASLTSSPTTLAIDDTEPWNLIADVLLEALRVSHDELRASQKGVAEQSSGYLKTEAKREEIRRILDSSESTMALPNATIDSGLTPQVRDYQRRLKSGFALLERQHADVQARVARIKENGQGILPSLCAPAIDTIQRSLANMTNTARQKDRDLDELAVLVDSLAISDPVGHGRRPRKETLSSTTSALSPHRNRTHSTADADSAAPLRTAAAGTPWSPKELPFNTPSFGRREGGFGLSLEDLASYDQSAVASQQASGNSHQADATGANPNFPFTQVRELAPRSSKANRKASLVLDSEPTTPGHDLGDGASITSTSAFSGAAAYIQARRQRSLVRDALTRCNRTTALIRSPESATTRAYKLGSLSSSIVPEPAPMPNLERYIQVFGKLKIEEPTRTPEPELELEAQQDLPLPVEPTSNIGFVARKAQAGEWQCSLCDLMNPDSSVACIVCESSRPGIVPASPVGLAIDSKPPTASFSGFKPNGGLSLAGLAAALGPSSSSTLGPFGTPLSSFSSFAPPSGIAALPAAAPAPVFSGFKPSGGLSLSQTPAIPAAPAPLFGVAARPALSFTAFVPPAGSASFAPTTPILPAASEGGEEWVCEVCELKSPSRATVCTVCEAPKPSTSGSNDDIGGMLEHRLPAPSDSEESGADELSDEQHSDDDVKDYSDDSVEASEGELVSDEEELESDDGSEGGLDASGEASDVSDIDEISDADLTTRPALSYADAAKTALTGHANEEEVGLEHNATPASVDSANVAEAAVVASIYNVPEELEPTSPASARAGEHDHDSDGFVHVSQLESGLQSNADVSQAAEDDGALSGIASETSLDTSTNPASSTGEHVSDMASDLDDDILDRDDASDTESKILAAVSDELDRGISESQQQQPATESVAHSNAESPAHHFTLDPYLIQLLSGASITLVVEQALSARPVSTLEPTPVIENAASIAFEPVAESEAPIDSAEAEEAENAEPDDLPSAALHLGGSDVTSTATVGEDLLTRPSVPSQQHGETTSALDLDDLAAGIASAIDEAGIADEHASSALPSDGTPEASEQAWTERDQQTSHAHLPATGMPNAKSFFKAGRLGNFGNQFAKSALAASTGPEASSPSSGSALPKAFSTSATASTPAFGAKLDRPAFGIASMSSFGASCQSGQQQSAAKQPFGSIGKIGVGFSSRASPLIDPFAAYKGSSNILGAAPPTADQISLKSSPQPSLDGSSACTPGLDSSLRQTPAPYPKPGPPEPSVEAADPILSIIHGSDSEKDEHGDLDPNSDSE